MIKQVINPVFIQKGFAVKLVKAPIKNIISTR